MRIVSQKLIEGYILTEYENGESKLIPYPIDENGQEYVDLNPNKEIFTD